MSRTPARLALLLLCLTACGRTPTGGGVAQALAPFDAHALPGQAVPFAAQCRGCVGAASFTWAVVEGGAACTLEGVRTPTASITCPNPGLWVLRLDVSDSRGPGVPDYVNLTVRPASADGGEPDAGPPDAGPRDAGAPDAGPADAGPADAGAVDAGEPDAGPPDAGVPDAGAPDAGPADAGAPDAGPADAGPPDAGPPDAGAPDAGRPDAGADAGSISGTLALTLPDGLTAVSDAVPGDLLEALALPAGAASCSFAVSGGAYLLQPGSLPCTAAIYPLEIGSFSVQVTFQQGAATGQATAAVSVHDFVRTSIHFTTVVAAAADPLSGQVALAKSNGAEMYDPATDAGAAIPTNSHDTLCADALGGESVVGEAGGGLAGYDTRIASPAYRSDTSLGDVISVAMVGQVQSNGSWSNISLGSDGTDLALWSDSVSTPQVDSNDNFRLIASAVRAVGDPHESVGLYGVVGSRSVAYATFAALDATATGGAGLVSTTLDPDPLSFGQITALASGPQDLGTVWLGTDADGIYAFTGASVDRPGSLGVQLLHLAVTGPVDRISPQIGGPYDRDAWLLAGGALKRLSAVQNTVGAGPVVLDISSVPTGNLTSLSAALPGTVPALWVSSSTGLWRLGSDL